MSDQKRPAHELLLESLGKFVDELLKEMMGEIDKCHIEILSASITLIIHIMCNMVIPEKHRQEITEQLRKISAGCTIQGICDDIDDLADQILKEGKPEE